MADTYCDADLVTGANDGSSWANAWQTFQAAVDGATVDTCWCQGTDSISAQVDVDTNSGSLAAPIKFIGVNIGTTNEPPQASDIGTDYLVIDGQDNAINGLEFEGVDYMRFENIKVHSCDGTFGVGGSTAASTNITLCNVWSHDNAARGFDGFWLTSTSYIRCTASSNTNGGVYRPSPTSRMEFCTIKGNVGRGIELTGRGAILGCIIRDQTGAGGVGIFTSTTSEVFIRNCVIEGNTSHGIQVANGNGAVHISQCRITNQNQASTAGVSISATKFAHIDDCYFGNNTSDIDGDFDSPNGGNVTGGTDLDEGYTDSANDDYNLAASATLRSEPVLLD